MNRYGGDYNRGWGRGYDAEHRHWGSNPRYDRGLSYREQGRGAYDRGFSSHGGRQFGYDTGWNRGGYSNQGYDYRYGRGGREDMNRRRFGGQRGARNWEEQEMDLMTRRRPVSPWGPNVPGQDFGYSLGYGIGAGRYIHK